MYPWAVMFRELGWFGFVEMLVFIGVLGVGLRLRVAQGSARMGLTPERSLARVARRRRAATRLPQCRAATPSSWWSPRDRFSTCSRFLRDDPELAFTPHRRDRGRLPGREAALRGRLRAALAAATTRSCVVKVERAGGRPACAER